MPSQGSTALFHYGERHRRTKSAAGRGKTKRRTLAFLASSARRAEPKSLISYKVVGSWTLSSLSRRTSKYSPAKPGTLVCEPRKARRWGRQRSPTRIKPPFGGCSSPEVDLIRSLVFLLLFPDVLADHGFIAAHHGHPKRLCPEVLTNEIPLPLFSVHPCQMDPALALEIPNLPRYWLFWENRDNHVRNDPATNALLQSDSPSALPSRRVLPPNTTAIPGTESSGGISE